MSNKKEQKIVATSRYEKIIERIFMTHYNRSSKSFFFERTEFEKTAKAVGVDNVKNLGDIVYSFRYRVELPQSIRKTAPKGMEWIIESAGRAKYQFKLVPVNRIVPNERLMTIKIPDATPEIIASYAQNDEQALLAKVRYNKLIDIFLGLTTYSLQNHLRTTVQGMGQIEIDELYVGVDQKGCHYIIPVQAKSGSDKLSSVQAKQDIFCCKEKYPNLLCRSISTQFMGDEQIAMFELALEGETVCIVEERHYKLVPADSITPDDLLRYRREA